MMHHPSDVGDTADRPERRPKDSDDILIGQLTVRKVSADVILRSPMQVCKSEVSQARRDVQYPHTECNRQLLCQSAMQLYDCTNPARSSCMWHSEMAAGSSSAATGGQGHVPSALILLACKLDHHLCGCMSGVRCRMQA
jgi:hypothetical protein